MMHMVTGILQVQVGIMLPCNGAKVKTICWRVKVLIPDPVTFPPR